MSKMFFWVGGFVVVPVALVGFMSPPSMSGVCYLLALLLMWLGPWLGLRRRIQKLSTRAQTAVRWSGVVLFAATLAVRVVSPNSGRFQLEQMGAGSALRSGVARAVNERDQSGGASTLLRAFSLLPERGDALGRLFRDTYDRMDAAGENIATPLFGTLLFDQSAENFDVLHYRLDEPRGTLIFLHGYGGNISAICWEVAQSAKAAGYDTLCPSMRTRADWGSPRGGEILRAVLEELEPFEGPVVLAGLSAGAHGASILAPRFRRQIDGLVLISGAAQRAGRAGVPTLVVYGQHDEMFSPRVIRGYIHRTQARGVAMDAGHFIVLSERARVRMEVTMFLDARIR